MREAATYLPADSTRPAVVFFTDGKHDVAGVPASEVLPEAQRLFGDRTPFAFLPVGMGLDPNGRTELQAGLEDLNAPDEQHDGTARTARPSSGTTWCSGARSTAGNAVAEALEQVTCSFTVDAEPDAQADQATPTPKPENAPGLVGDVKARQATGPSTCPGPSPRTRARSLSTPTRRAVAPTDPPTGCRRRSCRRPSTRRSSTTSTTEPATPARSPPSARSARGPGRPRTAPRRRPGRPPPPTGVNADQRRSLGGRLGRGRPRRRGADHRLPLRVQRRRRRDLAAGERARLGRDLDPDRRPRQRHLVHLPRDGRERRRRQPGVRRLEPVRAVRQPVRVQPVPALGRARRRDRSPPSRPPGTSSAGIATACGRTSRPTSTTPRPSRSAAGRARASRSSATRSTMDRRGNADVQVQYSGSKTVRRPVGRRPDRREGRRRRRGHRSRRRDPTPSPCRPTIGAPCRRTPSSTTTGARPRSPIDPARPAPPTTTGIERRD